MMQAALIFAGAAATAWLWLAYLRRLDFVEPEPVKALVLVGAGGGVLAALPAAEANMLFSHYSGISLSPPLPLASAALVSTFIGLNEELCKLLATALCIRHLRQCDEPADAVVYAGTVALGFAALENVFYGLAHGPGILLVRSITSVPVHLGLAALWGYGLARWRFLPGTGFGAVWPWFLFAAGLHALYDTIIFAMPETLAPFSLALAVFAGWAVIRAMRGRITSLVLQSPFVRAGFCPVCSRLNPPTASTCAGCGTKIAQEFSRPCLGCRAKLDLSMRFCPRCGTPADSTSSH